MLFRRHGESFTNVLRNVRTHKNTVMVIRDSYGHVFGGFSTAVWSNHAQFQGKLLLKVTHDTLQCFVSVAS